MNLTKEYNLAVAHQQEHVCSAPPYEEYEKLFELAKITRAKRILEIGTGIGYTALVLAEACPGALIDTIEKDPIHAELAQKYFHSHNLNNRITVHNVIAEEFFLTLNEPYDLIFFDGYQIHYEFLPQYERLLKPNGLLILGNNHLSSKTSDQFFRELTGNGQWEVLEKFSDTTVARKIIS